MSIYNTSASIESGLKKIDWARSFMPAMSELQRELENEQPFKGVKISMSIHLEAKTAVLALALKAGGADICATGCNP